MRTSPRRATRSAGRALPDLLGSGEGLRSCAAACSCHGRLPAPLHHSNRIGVTAPSSGSRALRWTAWTSASVGSVTPATRSSSVTAWTGPGSPPPRPSSEPVSHPDAVRPRDPVRAPSVGRRDRHRRPRPARLGRPCRRGADLARRLLRHLHPADADHAAAGLWRPCTATTSSTRRTRHRTGCCAGWTCCPARRRTGSQDSPPVGATSSAPTSCSASRKHLGVGELPLTGHGEGSGVDLVGACSSSAMPSGSRKFRWWPSGTSTDRRAGDPARLEDALLPRDQLAGRLRRGRDDPGRVALGERLLRPVRACVEHGRS